MCHFDDLVGTKETAGAKRPTAGAEEVVFQSADLPFSAIYGHSYRFPFVLDCLRVQDGRALLGEQLNFSSIVFCFDVGRQLWTNKAAAHRRV
jgi:hypothetical protein